MVLNACRSRTCIYLTICDDEQNGLWQLHVAVIIVVFVSAQSVGIVSSLKRAATHIKGGEEEHMFIQSIFVKVALNIHDS